MAYMSQEMKKELAPGIKAVLNKYGVKGTLRVNHHSVLILNIKSGELDFIGVENADRKIHCELDGRDFSEVNHYQTHGHKREGSDEKINKFFSEISDAMNGKGTNTENFDKSDLQSDYFNVGWYVRVSIGDYDRAYQYTGV